MVGESDFDAPAAEIAVRLAAMPLAEILRHSKEMTLGAFGNRVTFSRKVFIPLTQLCRDVCHYCTFAKSPRAMTSPYLLPEQVLQIARAGAAAGCREALFTLGDQPEKRYATARNALAALGHDTTLSYLRAMAELVLRETGLLPHLNPGLMSPEDLAVLRPVSASMGVMLESAAARLCAPGAPHHGSPDKLPARRLATIEDAGRAAVPFTTGLLIGIGETRAERIEALVALRNLHRRYGHIQEIIIQNFRAKPGTRMAGHEEPDLAEHCWSIAAARLIMGPRMSIQAPPNLQPEGLHALLAAGANDWGGVSPVTPDHVNPEAPWPHLDELARATASAGRLLTERLCVGPQFAREPARWLDAEIAIRVRRQSDARGLPILDAWRPGTGAALPGFHAGPALPPAAGLERILAKASGGARLTQNEIVQLLDADGLDVARIAAAADALRLAVNGDAVTYVVNRNINYTNICTYKCGFCAFSKSSTKALRGPAYRIEFAEIAARAVEAWARGATEVCLQGGIHPDYDGNTYLGVVRAVRSAVPGMHIHAFSPLEIFHGARTLGLPLDEFLARLADAGLSTLPGTAAEILDDGVRAKLCPDKLNSGQWVEVMRAAHGVGLRSTATMMFGHVDDYASWARHLLTIRDLQAQTGGFTEFVPLPFVHMEAPIWRKGLARSGPSWREVVLVHAVARLALHGMIPNIQASWVKLGEEGVRALLNAGVNDLGGVLMDESITRAAGGQHGQCFDAARMRLVAAAAGRVPRQRNTVYGVLPDARSLAGDSLCK